MTEDQQKLYDQIRSMFHDERLQCSNLARMIPLLFPKTEDEEVTAEIMDSLIPILEARAELGTRVMDIFYDLEGGEE